MNQEKRSPRLKHFLFAAAISFNVGVILMSLMLLGDQKSNSTEQLSKKREFPGAQKVVPPKSTERRSVFSKASRVDGDDLLLLRQKHLLFPLRGLDMRGTKDSFQDARSGHIHEAIDIVAPRNTHILAVEDGTIAKLWHSKYGGITIYQFDPTKTYAYYYAHLERYADGLEDGDKVSRGQLLGYVGTSGNAPPNTPHLHFTIFKLTEEKVWHKGSAVNPYLVFSQMQ